MKHVIDGVRSMGRVVVFACLVVAGAGTAAAGEAAQMPSAHCYYLDGLIAQWDGIDNVGVGTHDATATKWYDLVGTRHLALVSGAGAFTNGNALACLARSQGHSAGPAANCADYKTIEFMATPQQGSKSSSLPFYSGVVSRGIIFETGFAGTLASTSYRIWSNRTTTLAVTYDGDTVSNYYDNATVLTATGSTDNWGAHTSGVCVGERSATGGGPYQGEVYAIRLYDHVLSTNELAYNAAIDRVRYCGADFKTEMSAFDTFPEGLRWNASTEQMEVCVSGEAEMGSLSVSDDWFALGDTVSVTYTSPMDRVVVTWVTYPKDATFSDDGRTITFVANGPTTLYATANRDQPFTTANYVQDGLVLFFDALCNARDANGALVHDNSATTWLDLVSGTGYALETLSSDRWTDNAYVLGTTSSRFRFAPNGMGGVWMLEFLETGNSATVLDSSDDKIWWKWGSTLKFEWRAGTRPSLPVSWKSGETLLVASDSSWYGVAQGTSAWSKVSNALGTKSHAVWTGLGKGGDGDTPTAGTKCHFVRKYDHILTDAERSLNYCIDKVRYGGVLPGAVFATALLPDGYRWNSELNQLEIRLTLEVTAGAGTFSGECVESQTEAWYPAGLPSTLIFTPSGSLAFGRWVTTPDGTTATSGGVCTFTAYRPSSVKVACDMPEVTTSSIVDISSVESRLSYTLSRSATRVCVIYGETADNLDHTNEWMTAALSGSLVFSGYRTGVTCYARILIEDGGAYACGDLMSFIPPRLCFVTEAASETGSGDSWADAANLTNALVAAAASSVPSEIWLAGTFSNAVAQTYAFTQPITIHGGFAGTEAKATERTAGAQSVIHAGKVCGGLSFSNTQDVYLDGLCLSNCTTCLTKSGAGSVTASNCVFRTSSQGASFTGASTATLHLTDCEFCEIDSSSTWRAAYIKTFSRAFVDNCYFHHVGKTQYYRGKAGPAFLCESAPITMRGTRFSGCWEYGDQQQLSGLCRILSAAAACAFTNCVWTGTRHDTVNSSVSTLAEVYVSLAAQSTPCSFVNCTIAYNRACTSWTYLGYPGGLHIAQGTVQVRNSIFFGNLGPANNTVPMSLYVASGASCYVTNSLFEADSGDHFKAADGGTLDVDRTSCVFGDPLFVTPRATAVSQITTWGAGDAFDLHLLSSEGYFTNDGTEHTAEDTLSPAVDAGRKGDDYSLEPSPNGGRINMGVYGNTPEASKSPAFEIALGTPTIAFDPPYTQPTVTFTTGGTGIYSASAVVSVSTNGTDWTYVSGLITAITNGATRTYTVPAYLLPVGSAWAKVTLTCNEQEVTVTSAATPVEGTLPPWFGKGGGANVIHVRPGACCKKDGTSWTDAYDDLYTAMRNLDATRTELWIAGTNYYVVTDRTPSFPSVTVRGGFTGTENAIADRQDGVRSQVDGKSMYGLGFKCTGSVLFERLDFANCTTCISDSSGASDFTVTNCNFRSSGGGVYAVGKSTADLTVRDCTFVRMAGSGTARGVYGQSFRRIYVDDCTFERLGESATYRGTIGPALYADAAPATVRRCRFAGCWSYGNQSTPDSSMAILSGTTSECAFTNCVFTGGYCYDTENRSQATCKTLMRISLGSAAAVCRFERCTFAYNMTANSGWSGGLYVTKGDVYIRDSIFFGNRVHSSTTLPSDIYVLSAATCHVAYTSFESTNTSHCAAASGGTLEIDGATCPIIDPFFVTDAATGVAGLGNAAKSAAFDVHLLSPKGYWKNDGNLYTDAETCSSAIDAGDLDIDVLDEPEPNGGRLNLGAYAGTAHASKTSIVVPIVGGIDVSFPDGVTQPHCLVRMTAEDEGDVYNATVTILCYTGTVESAGMTFSTTYQNVANGQVITNIVPWCYAPGVPLTVKVTVSANGVTPFSETASATVEGHVSPHFGKGGGAGICHVRDGATGLGDGSDWFNAYPGLHAAFTAIKYSGSSAYSEMWVFETNSVPVSLEKLTATADLVVRGGFAGTESSASERRAGARTVLDGGQTNELLRIENAAGRAVTLERFDIVKAYEHGVNKSGAGDLTLRDCRFLNNSYTSWRIDGRGAYIAGSGAARIVVTNCEFRGNGPLAGKRNYSYCKGNGHGIYVASCARATFDDCIFATNGQYGVSGTSTDSCAGTAIFADGTPVTVRRTKFVGNRGAVRDNNSVLGGTVRLSGSGCADSAFTNCLFVGNSAYCGWGNTEGSYGGALVLTCGSKSATTDVKNCTFAYNYADGTTSAGGLNVYAGTANVKDCIFARNGVSGRTVSGVTTRKAADIDVKANGICNISYTMLSTNDVMSCDGTGTFNLGEGVVYGDPRFMMLEKLSSYTANAGLKLCYASFLQKVNVHLRGRVGYIDETTGLLMRHHGEQSPAIDAGDPASDYTKEPDNFDGTHGGRVNLGAYGNTPWATMTRVKGVFLRLR